MNEYLDPRILAKDVRPAQNGDPDAMNRLLASVQDMVYYSCLRMLRNEAEAQDASQDILITIYQKLRLLSDPLSYLGWVKRIVANRCRDRLSKSNREFLLNDTEEGQDAFSFYEDLDEQRVPDKALDNAETRRMINELIDRLPDEQRVCVILYYYNEMKTREIAESLGVSEGTVKSRLNYARKSIKEGVEGYEKQGVKLYGLSPLLFLGYFLRKAGSSVHAPFTVSIPGASAGAASAANAAGAKAASSAAGRTASAGAQTAGRTALAGARTAANAGARTAASAAGKAAAGTAAKAAASSGFGAFLSTTAGKIVAAVAITAVLGGAVTGTVFAVKAASEKADRAAETSAQASPEPGIVTISEEEQNPSDQNGNGQSAVPDDEIAVPGNESPDVISPSQELSSKIISVACGEYFTVALRADGTAASCGGLSGQNDLSNWTDLTAIGAGGYHAIGAKKDGTVVAVGSNYRHEGDISGWTDVIAVSAGEEHTVGLRSDGTVVAVGSNDYGQCSVSDWTDIVEVDAGRFFTVGLKSDGTAVAVGWDDYGQCSLSDWTDISAIAAGGYHTVGLKKDGSVVAAGWNSDGQCDVSGWTDIVAIAAGYSHTVGLRSDGTVVSVGDDRFGQCDVSGWTGIVKVAAGYFHTVGLRSDGSVVAVGQNDHGQCDVAPWNTNPVPAPQPEPVSETTANAKLIRSYESGQSGAYYQETFSDTMFTCDLNGDGAEEEVSYRSEAYDSITVTAGDVVITIHDEWGIAGVRDTFVVDLDPESPRLHLAINAFTDPNFGDRCFLLHVENGEFRIDFTEWGNLFFDEEQLFFAPEATEALGTRGPGCRALIGDSLTPDSEWYECRPNAGMGRYYYNAAPLRLKRDLPCTIDDVETVIPKDSNVYYYGILASEEACKVKTEDGRIAIVKLEKTGGWPAFRIDGIPQDDYFADLEYYG